MALSADRRKYYVWRGLGTALETLPVQVAVRIAEIFGWAVAFRGGGTRVIAEANLRQVVEFGSSESIDSRVLRRWVRRYYASYARYWAEGATLPAVAPGVIQSRIVLAEGADVLREAMAAGKGVVVALPHVGSWEWGGALLAGMGFPMTAVAEKLEPAELFEWFVEKRSAIGLIITPLESGAGQVMLSTLRQGGLVGLLCDRDLTGDGIEVTMLDRPTMVPAGPATLALRTGATLLAGVVSSGPGNQHVALLSNPIETERRGRLRSDVARVSQNLADAVSGLIRRSPEQWHVFSPAFADETAE